MFRRFMLMIVVMVANFYICTPHVLAQQRTSENTPLLKKWLKMYPAADTNKDGILTEDEAKAYLAKRQKGKRQATAYEIAPAHANVSYGPHERNVLDLWLAKRDDGKPTPLAIFIHGGGFTAGDKSKLPVASLKQLLAAKISVASINYRLVDSGPFPNPMLDGARAIQFLRYHADKYNLDKNRVACFGGSAGGCMSMWLAMHADLADPKNANPVLRESTRLTCAAPNAGQSCLEADILKEWFHCDNLQEFPSTRWCLGITELDEMKKPEVIARMKEASPIAHLTADDPPIFASYNQANTPVNEKTPSGTWVHHPIFGIKLKEQMDHLHLECHVQYPGSPADPQYKSSIEFLIDKLHF